MSNEMREAFERLHRVPSRRSLTEWEGFQSGYQAATAAAEAKYRDVIEQILGECRNWRKFRAGDFKWDCDTPQAVKNIYALAAPLVGGGK